MPRFTGAPRFTFVGGTARNRIDATESLGVLRSLVRYITLARRARVRKREILTLVKGTSRIKPSPVLTRGFRSQKKKKKKRPKLFTGVQGRIPPSATINFAANAYDNICVVFMSKMTYVRSLEEIILSMTKQHRRNTAIAVRGRVSGSPKRPTIRVSSLRYIFPTRKRNLLLGFPSYRPI